MHSTRFALISGLLYLMPVGLCGFAPVALAAEEKAKDWTLNLKDVDIRVFLQQISAITGENFVVDPQVKGKVSVIATTPMNASAVHELLLTVLRVNGYTAVASGSSTRIVPLSSVKGGGEADGDATSTQGIITRVITAKNVNIDEAVKILKPMVSPAGYLEGSTYSNALVVSDYADNVAHVMKALQNLEKGTPSEVEVIALKDAWVGNIVPLIEAMSPAQLGDSGKGKNRLRVVADERSNSLVVRGDAQERAAMRQLVATLDKKTTNGSDIQMIRLKNADAKEMATLLRGMVFASAKAGGQAPLPASPALAGDSNAAAMDKVFGAQAGNDAKPLAVDASGTQSFIQADVALNAIVVRAEPGVMSQIRSIVKQMDVRRPQVLIEAAIVEITADKTQQLGVQYAGGAFAQKVNGVTTQFSQNQVSIGTILSQLGSPNASRNGDGLAVALGGANFNVLIQALSSTSGANLLSTPSITTLDNAEAKIVVGQNVPFRTGNFSTQQAGVVNPFTTIERQDIGITLKVIPQIHEGNLVRLSIQQEVSSIADTLADPDAAADIITNKRTINTTIVAQNGETVVLGGLMEDNTAESVGKVPVLGDLPVLGALFRNKQQTGSKRNLFVFLRPTVLADGAQTTAAAQKQYDRVYDLQMGNKKLGDDFDVETAQLNKPSIPAPPADAVFDSPPKSSHWFLD